MRLGLGALISIVLVGCATADPSYYTNPKSPGYTELRYGGMCERCDMVFKFSQSYYDLTHITDPDKHLYLCSNCGLWQSLDRASVRYLDMLDLMNQGVKITWGKPWEEMRRERAEMANQQKEN